MPSAANAQLTPDRLYYGRHRAIPMTVRAPADKSGNLSIAVFRAGDSEPKISVPVSGGAINLAQVLPELWEPGSDHDQPRQPMLFYAQLMSGLDKIGPAVVLQPLLDPAYAPLIEQDGQPRYRPSKGIYSGLRAYIEKHVVIETSLGDITLALRPDAAPNTSWHFMQLCAGGFYTDIVFHRIRPTNPTGAPFVIQAGDPLQRLDPEASPTPGSGEGGPGFTINLEQSSLPHDFGVLAMARNNLPNSAGSQFYIALSRKGTESLDGKYTTFAQAVGGAETILKIAALELAPGSERPKDPPLIKRCRVIDAPPRGESPPPVKRPDAPAPER
jgi:peptidyl-prolyl cis-trans isomerase B (cyclophilin B)